MLVRVHTAFNVRLHFIRRGLPYSRDIRTRRELFELPSNGGEYGEIVHAGSGSNVINVAEKQLEGDFRSKLVVDAVFHP